MRDDGSYTPMRASTPGRDDVWNAAQVTIRTHLRFMLFHLKTPIIRSQIHRSEALRRAQAWLNTHQALAIRAPTHREQVCFVSLFV